MNQGSFDPQASANHTPNQQNPGAQQPNNQQPNYQQANNQQPNYQQANYQQANYQQPNYQQPNYQQPNYQQANYQQPYYQPPVQKYRPPYYGQSLASMICGICSLALLSLPAGIVAVVLAYIAKKHGNNSNMTKAGLITGIIGSAISGLYLVMVFAGLSTFLFGLF